VKTFFPFYGLFSDMTITHDVSDSDCEVWGERVDFEWMEGREAAKSTKSKVGVTNK
jgi:hypothetical protein